MRLITEPIVELWARTRTYPALDEHLDWNLIETDAEHLVEAAGRSCYQSFHRPNPTTADTGDYLRRTVFEQGHGSITEQSRRRQQMHVCPLQFDIVDRLIERFSNPDDVVYDPFGGVGTVPLRALKAGRRGRGVELNAGYWADAVSYLKAEENKAEMPTLFDLIGGAA